METVSPIYGNTDHKNVRTFTEWLKKEIETVKGTTENWETSYMEVRSPAALKEPSGIQTNLF